jgi:hypothetical protein
LFPAPASRCHFLLMADAAAARSALAARRRVLSSAGCRTARRARLVDAHRLCRPQRERRPARQDEWLLCEGRAAVGVQAYLLGGDLVTQHLDELEEEAERTGGALQILANHFTTVYKVDMPCAPATWPLLTWEMAPSLCDRSSIQTSFMLGLLTRG